MSSDSIEQALRDLRGHGQLIKDRPYRQIWRIEIDGTAYYLKFYPRAIRKWKRIFTGNPALREFSRLQNLQKARIPAPRAVSVLVGFRVGKELGDAVLMHAIEPGITLDQYFNELELTGGFAFDRRRIESQIADILQSLIQSRLGHRDLHLGNFLLSRGKVYLLDAYALRPGGIRKNDLLMLGHSVRKYATTTEMLRLWRKVGGIKLPTLNNRISRKFWRKEMSRIEKENAYFGLLHDQHWRGCYFKARKYPALWSLASRLRFTSNDWHDQWPRLLGQLQSGQLLSITEAGQQQVFEGEIVLAGVPINVIVYRFAVPWPIGILCAISPVGARRWWRGAWSLVVRDIAVAWPIVMAERRLLGIVREQLIVFEKASGVSLIQTPLDELTRAQRDVLFFRLGRWMRKLEQSGFYCQHARAKSFLIHRDPADGPSPLLTRIEGIKKIHRNQTGILHLLDDLRHALPAYNPADSYALCRGYAPAARMEKEA